MLGGVWSSLFWLITGGAESGIEDGLLDGFEVEPDDGLEDGVEGAGVGGGLVTVSVADRAIELRPQLIV